MQPLALVFYERLMPGSQLVNRLQDLNYRVLAVNVTERLAATVQRELPLLLFIDLAMPGDVCGAIAALHSTSATAHIPIVAFAPDNGEQLLAEARSAGAKVAVSDSAISNYLSQIVDQALQVD